ncbi:BatA domain-containing protein [Muriicola sp. SD30]|uniref:BatA domain-containing protein n=1 Tax=Muriicola sp. SD30 TaxID=3240936 RepID=UPI003510ACD0
MLFKYPQLLWSLWLLLIPILIHLLQLRRFKPTPFTNVRLLQRVQAKSQKSQTLKRWLLLLTRMALFTALIIAFAQPFVANPTAFKEQEITIYLDNSFSMQARQDNNSLLENAIQELITAIPEDVSFSLFTNDSEFREVTLGEIRNSMLQLPYASNQLTLREIILKGQTFFNGREDVLKKLILISDFQKSMESDSVTVSEDTELVYVPIRSEELRNIAIDSAYIRTTSASDNELVIKISANTDFGSTPVSLYNRGDLIAKSAVTYSPSESSELVFSLPGRQFIEGVVSLSDSGLEYDNELYFTINTREKIKVLAVGDSEGVFLNRLFGDDLTEFRNIRSLDQGITSLNEQDLIILNQVPRLPPAMKESLREFIKQGGSLLLIPSVNMNISEFNLLLNSYGISFGNKNETPVEITGINYTHPLYSDVFEERVDNFDYPKVQEHYRLNGRWSGILTYANEQPFLASRDNLYVFTASLDPGNSNFTSSPLIVPTLYAMAVRSRSLSELYYLLGENNSVDISEVLEEDRILSLKKEELEFIPRQQLIGEKTRLWFDEIPTEPGIYSLENAETEKSFSFNHKRTESQLNFLNNESFHAAAKVNNSISGVFQDIESMRAVTSLWKWFVILALLFILAEVIIQKALK